MGKFISVSVACLQYAGGLYIFKKPEVTGNGPWLACLLVLFATFLILWSISLYPRSLRKQIGCANYLVQYFVAVFLVEYTMSAFWFPLDNAVLALLPATSSYIEELLRGFDVTCHYPCDVMKEEVTGVFFSYAVSVIIVIGALHASRVINLRILFEEGVTAFVSDVKRRLGRFFQSLNASISNIFPNRAHKVEFEQEEDDYHMEPQDSTLYRRYYRS